MSYLQRLVLQFSSVAFALLVQQNLANTCERINTSILQGCDQIGYNFTAKFPDVHGEDYQTFIEPHVSMLNNLLANCSSYSKLIVCSRHVPKCTENLEPMLPCRDVCENFVADCSSVLQNNGIRRLYSALCDLLPAQDDGNSPSCILPKGFSPKVSVKEGNIITTKGQELHLEVTNKVVYELYQCALPLRYEAHGSKAKSIPQCKNVTAPACQTANYTLLPNVTNTRLQASLGQLNLSCSPRVEQFTCYTHSAPCYGSEGKALFPCRALCEEIRPDCGRPNHIPFSSCFLDFPGGNSTIGLCELDTWYVQKWPRLQEKQDAKLECYCDSCNSSKCKTDGSCFVELLLEDEKTTIERGCLDTGIKRDVLCDPNETIEGTKCCEDNLCNENVDAITKPSPTVKVETNEKVSVKPTSISPATTTRNNTGIVAESGTSAGVKAGIAVAVLLTVAAAGVAVFLVYKRYKTNHTGVKLSHEKLSDLREIKGNANNGFVELHESADWTSASGGEKLEELDKNDSDALSVEQTKKRKPKGTVTFGAVTVGGAEDGEGSYNISGFFSHESALY